MEKAKLPLFALMGREGIPRTVGRHLATKHRHATPASDDADVYGWFRCVGCVSAVASGTARLNIPVAGQQEHDWPDWQDWRRSRREDWLPLSGSWAWWSSDIFLVLCEDVSAQIFADARTWLYPEEQRVPRELNQRTQQIFRPYCVSWPLGPTQRNVELCSPNSHWVP